MNRDDRSVLMWGSFGLATAALFVAIAGLTGLADGPSSSGEAAGSASMATVVDVTLSEFAITPAAIVAPPGGITIRITNAGSMTHNFSIPGLSVKTKDLNPGETETLELGTLSEGAYDTLCDIPGHAGSGMVATLTITGGAHQTDPSATAGPDDGLHGYANWQEMDQAMEVRAKAYPAATAGGYGGRPFEPTILDDGTKEFAISVDEIDREVEPGKTVKAKAYNGMVPGPEIRVNVGDRVRIVVTNNLNESTSMHFHGIRVPNEYDGVDPYTQKPIMPGETFVYEWTTVEPAVGIYHSHHDAQVQIPDGMFGAFFIGEMPIPDVLKEKGYTQVDQKITMVLNDAGTIGLSLNGKSFPATEAYSMRVGEVVEVTYQNEGLQGHPMHMHQPIGWITAKDGVPLIVPMPTDTPWVAPGERYTVLYKATDVGVWAWHCHILSHAEGPNGMFGMVSALIVTP